MQKNREWRAGPHLQKKNIENGINFLIPFRNIDENKTCKYCATHINCLE